jgi:hypothetical protein
MTQEEGILADLQAASDLLANGVDWWKYLAVRGAISRAMGYLEAVIESEKTHG